MPALKLTKLPDRKAVRMMITLSPNLRDMLDAYTDAYNAAYEESESVSVLIPHILESFLASDRAFTKAMKANGDGDGATKRKVSPSQIRRRQGASAGQSSSTE